MKVLVPSLKGPVTFDAAEDAFGYGTIKAGSLAQASGLSAGFDLFTPTTNCTYWLCLRGQDVASGAPTNAFLDVLQLTASTGWAPSATQTNTFGTPGARTYSNNAGALKIVVATGTTWYIDVYLLRFPA